MQEPTVRTSRVAIAGGLLAAIAIGGGGFLIGRSTTPRPAPPAQDAMPAPVVLPTPSPAPGQTAPLGRADLAAIASRAADALTSATSDTGDVDVVGRRVDLVLPFGCDGPNPDPDASGLSWRYDADAGVLRLRAVPISWAPAEWGLGDVPGGTIEGFWLSRPWSSLDRCPRDTGRPSASGTEPVTLPGQTLAVAQFLSADAPRDAVRDGRAFESVQRVAGGEFDATNGFRLRLIGRVGEVPGGGAVRCQQPAGIEQRPICVVALALDEVMLENPATGQRLATWTIGAPTRSRE